jgi:hypothetical protein
VVVSVDHQGLPSEFLFEVVRVDRVVLDDVAVLIL